MSADHAVGFVVAGGCQHGSIPEISEKLDGLAGGITEIVGKRAAFIAFLYGLTIIPVMDSLGSRVRVRADHRQQAIWIQRTIELMPMDHKHPGTVAGGVD
jgi:hypothetical protein